MSFSSSPDESDQDGSVIKKKNLMMRVSKES